MSMSIYTAQKRETTALYALVRSRQTVSNVAYSVAIVVLSLSCLTDEYQLILKPITNYSHQTHSHVCAVLLIKTCLSDNISCRWSSGVENVASFTASGNNARFRRLLKSHFV